MAASCYGRLVLFSLVSCVASLFAWLFVAYSTLGVWFVRDVHSVSSFLVALCVLRAARLLGELCCYGRLCASLFSLARVFFSSLFLGVNAWGVCLSDFGRRRRCGSIGRFALFALPRTPDPAHSLEHIPVRGFWLYDLEPACRVSYGR